MKFGVTRYTSPAPSAFQFGKYDERMSTGEPTSLTSKLIVSWVVRTLVTFAFAPGAFVTGTVVSLSLARFQSDGPLDARRTSHSSGSLNQSTAGRAQV